MKNRINKTKSRRDAQDKQDEKYLLGPLHSVIL